MDAHLPGWLWPIALFGGLGAFIDFLLGRVGRKRTRDFLHEWWIRFDDVTWRNFGRQEAFLAISAMDRWWGRRLFTARRWSFVAWLSVMAICLGCIIAFIVLLSSPHDQATPYFQIFGEVDPTSWQILPMMVVASVALATYLSIIRIISMLVARFRKDGVC